MFFQPQEITYDATYDERPDGEPIIMGAVATHVESGLSVECRQFGSYYRNREAAKVELEAEMTRRAEVALIASPSGADGEGRLTPCREVDVGLVGNLGDSGAIGSRAPLHGITRGCTNG